MLCGHLEQRQNPEAPRLRLRGHPVWKFRTCQSRSQSFWCLRSLTTSLCRVLKSKAVWGASACVTAAFRWWHVIQGTPDTSDLHLFCSGYCTSVSSEREREGTSACRALFVQHESDHCTAFNLSKEAFAIFQAVMKLPPAPGLCSERKK